MEGIKFNDKKSKLHLIFRQFPRAISKITDLSQYGHLKYSEGDEDYQNFSRVPEADTAYQDAMLRHISDMYSKGEIDESGFHHKAHIAWNALADLELILRKQEHESKTK
jgi:hypothetical protein